MLDDIKKDAVARMAKCVQTFQADLKKLRTGRAHPSLIEHLKVDYYGSEVPLQQVASISVEEGRTLVVSPWEKSSVQAVEKAIHKSDLGLNPLTAGTVIRINMPPLTEERRRRTTSAVRRLRCRSSPTNTSRRSTTRSRRRRRRSCRFEARDPPAAHRNHHGWQWEVGRRARPAPACGPRGRDRRRADVRRALPRARHPRAHDLRVLERELAAPERRGGAAHGALCQRTRPRGRRAPRKRRALALHRRARAARRAPAGAHRRRGGANRGEHRARAASRRELRGKVGHRARRAEARRTLRRWDAAAAGFDRGARARLARARRASRS